jgi:hypothetical protein
LEFFRVWGRAFVAAADGELSVQDGASGAVLAVALGGAEAKAEAVAEAAGAVFSFLGLAGQILLWRRGVRQTVVDAVVGGCGLGIRGTDVAVVRALLLNWLLRDATFAGRAVDGGLLIAGLRGLLGLGRGRQVGGSVNGLLLEGPRI